MDKHIRVDNWIILGRESQSALSKGNYKNKRGQIYFSHGTAGKHEKSGDKKNEESWSFGRGKAQLVEAES